MKLLFLNKIKKNIAWFLCFVFIFSFFSVPSNVKATLPVIDKAALGFANMLNIEVTELIGEQTTSNAKSIWAKLGNWAMDKAYQIQDAISQKAIVVKEYILDGIAWTAANVIIDQFGDALVDWIRNGFDGSPMFLSDPEGFFRDTANQLSGAIINDLDMEWLCDPLGKLNINIDFFFPGTNRAKYRCTFNDIADTLASYADRDDLSDWINVNVNVRERNIVREFGNDYRNGGFLMWLLTAEEKNNDLGRTLQTANDAYMAASISVGSEKFHLNYNRGFFGVRKCVEYVEGGELVGMTSEGKNAGKPPCKKWETKTPGTLVQDQLDDVGGKDLSRLQVADEIDEIIGALVTTMIGWVLTGGTDEEGEPIGVLGYDSSNKNYAGSQRDHYGELSKSRQTTTKKSDISGQVTNIKSNEEPYSDSLENYADALYGAKEKLEIVLAKLKCVRATSTNDTGNAYDDTDCDGADEDIKNISLSAVDKTESDISSDISKTDEKISDIESKISSFNSKYGENATSTSAQALELFDEFEEKIMTASDKAEIETLEGDYCYSYDKKNETGTICGAFGDDDSVQTYQTHSDKEFKDLSKEAAKIEGKMESAELEYSCILDEYTQAEDVSQSECGSFESSSSSSAEEPVSSADEAGSSSSE